jgi:hypothetical protein
VSEFIEECRREWKRLRVPDPIADEMAAEFAADLQEAETEGVPPEVVLGPSASDPRAFAASWAAERGVTRPRFRDKVRRRPLLITASVLLAVLLASLITAVLLVAIRTSDHPARRVAPARVAMRDLGATYGAAVALEPSTGRVLVLASKPSYNPNDVEGHFDCILRIKSPCQFP